MKKIFIRLQTLRKDASFIVQSLRGWERFAFIFLSIGLLVGMIGILATLNHKHSVDVPVAGGTHQEGIIGTPRFINPVLAKTDTDHDLVQLVYSGLLRNTDGNLIHDLAASYEISEDELSYTFTLKENLTFHDNKPLTASDVIFTLQKIQDSTIESPLYVPWRDITAEALDDHRILFTLKEPRASFLDSMTFGIIPQHVWENTNFIYAESNILAIGSGPYKIVRIDNSRSGVTEKITLRRFNNFALGKPFIKRVIIKFYANNEDLLASFKKGSIDAIHATHPSEALAFENDSSVTIYDEALPRVFGVFFNANQKSIFLDTEIIKALNISLNKDALINRALYGFGTPLEGPLPPQLPGYEPIPESQEAMTKEDRIQQAASILEKQGWSINSETGIREKNGTPLAFSLSTSNAPELVEVAEILKERFNEIGVSLNVQVFEVGNLVQEIIRPRSYEALLFGQYFQHDTDLYAFWHSTHRNDPGLNVSLFINSTADQALSDALKISQDNERAKKYAIVTDAISEKPSAIFLYSPHFIYISNHNTQGITLGNIRSSSDRFNTIYQWYTETQNIWQPYVKKTN
jgi:peptide/nickel transport system substrate-binding protein